MPCTHLVRHTALLLSLLACAACSTAPNQQTTEEKESTRSVRTGSHIPVKDPDSSYSKSIDVQSVQDSMRTSGSRATPPKGN